jgi:competence protein ComEC
VAGLRTGIVMGAAGVGLVAQLPELPDATLVAFLPLAVLAAWLSAPARPMALFACAILWASLRGHCVLLATLPVELEGQTLVVEGTVAGLSAGDARRLRFDFLIADAHWDTRPLGFRGAVRLGWYRDAPAMAPGERWRLVVRLKRPRGLVNPAGFDYERWLFRRGTKATGYVVSGADNRPTSASGGTGLHGLRYRLARTISAHLEGRATAALIAALAVGDRAAMTREQWRILAATGTSHLMAISGLHVGLVAGLAYFLVGRLWSLAATPVLWLAAPRAAGLAAMAAGAVYAALAGFALPTQRALTMLGVVMAGIVAGRRVSPATSLCVALGAVLVMDPFAVISAGFWLSFGAVAVILWGMGARVRAGDGPGWRRVAWRWGRVQWLVAIGLLPVTVALFLAFPLVAPFANLLAVPWAGLVLVPLVVAGAVLLLPFPSLGAVLLDAARWAADVLWWLLVHLAELELMLRPAGAAPQLALLVACVGALLLIAPRGVPARHLGVVALLPLLFYPTPRPGYGDYRLTLLDVGQGLAAVVRTHTHVLVYDTGPSYGSGFDAGRDVIVPYLRSQGVARVDRLVISHENSDHAGGAAALHSDLPVLDMLSNDPRWRTQARPCRAETRWRWDGVDFEILNPAPGGARRGNDASCVLKVSGEGGRALLTGDVERRAEAAMLSRTPAKLRAEVLVVPHHGSRSSSTATFLDAVQPRVALIPVAYRNRYRFPHASVLARLAAREVRVLDTARHGAISVEVEREAGIRVSRLERVARSRIWRVRP